MHNSLTRILFAVLLLMTGVSAFAQDSGKPNILIIMTDQQFGDAMSCAMGDEFLKTPNMDYLAANGVRFTRAYSPNPLCTPMRTSMMTGQFPHQTRVQTNNDRRKFIPEDHIYLGKAFEDAGYEMGYFGKWHVAINEELKNLHGFNIYNGNLGRLDAKPVSDFIQKDHKKPFFAFASFLSPHEVCQWARKEELPGEQLGEIPSLEQLPPLKPNFGIPQNETDIETYMRKSYQANRRFTVGNYTAVDWRRLRWGYYRLIERADEFVGEVISALKISGKMENTIIVFLSDHGDCAGSHGWNQKTVFYEESTRVPFIFSWAKQIPVSTSDQLVNVSLDLFPTLCELSGIPIPARLPGLSLNDVLMGKRDHLDREYLVVQNHMVQGDPIEDISLMPHGRMIRSEDFKYYVFSEGKDREVLFDMQYDPLEMVNQAKNPVYKSVLQNHRNYLKSYAENLDDARALDIINRL